MVTIQQYDYELRGWCAILTVPKEGAEDLLNGMRLTYPHSSFRISIY